jgi:hypothetical protein
MEHIRGKCSKFVDCWSTFGKNVVLPFRENVLQLGEIVVPFVVHWGKCSIKSSTFEQKGSRFWDQCISTF